MKWNIFLRLILYDGNLTKNINLIKLLWKIIPIISINIFKYFVWGTSRSFYKEDTIYFMIDSTLHWSI